MANDKNELTLLMSKCNQLIDEFVPQIITRSEIHALFEKSFIESQKVRDYANTIENKVLTIENYVEKYMPLQNLRQM